LIRSAGAMAGKSHFRRLLFISDMPVPDELTQAKGPTQRKLVRVVTTEVRRSDDERWPTLTIPAFDLSRPEKLRLALLDGLARGLLAVGNLALTLVGREPRSYPDSLVVSQVGAGLSEEAGAQGMEWTLGKPEVVEAVL